MKRLIIFFILAAWSLCEAQRLPSWMNELPHSGNGTYLYVRESGEGSTLTQATNAALLRVMQSTANRLGRPFDANEVDFALGHSTSLATVSRQYNIPINKVDEYDQQLADGTYRVWVLCQVAMSATVQPVWEELRREGEVNNWTSLAKSAVVPGLGQMGKGYTAEGVVTLAGEVLLVGTGIGSYYLAQADLRTMRDASTTYADFAAARDRYNTLRTTSYIAWGAAAVLYAFNLYRAFAMQPRHADGLAVAPVLITTPNAPAAGLNLTYRL